MTIMDQIETGRNVDGKEEDAGGRLLLFRPPGASCYHYVFEH